MKKLALLLVLAVSVTSAFAQTAVSSAVNVGALADGDVVDANPSVTNSSTMSQGATIGTLSASALATDTSSYFATSYSNVKASWMTAGSGNIGVNGGWRFDTSVSGGAALNTYVTGQKVWEYTFTATSNSTLNFNWNVVGAGSTFGLHRFVFTFTGAGGNEDLGPVFYYPDGNGSLSRSLLIGQTYTMGLTNFSNVSGGVGTSEGSYNGNFDWDVQPVPEPMSMSVLALGVASALRRKRK